MKKSLVSGYIALFLGIIALSLSPIFVKGSGAPTVVTSFYRMVIPAIILTPFMLIEAHKEKKNGEPSSSDSGFKVWMLFPLLSGICTGLDHGIWSISLARTSTGNASVLNSMAPVWIALASLIFLKEKLGGKFWVGLALTAIGLVFISGKGLDFFREGFNDGDALALLSSVFNAGYFLFTQLSRGHYSSLKQLWTLNVICALILFGFCRAMGCPLTGYSREVVINFFLVALICQLGGYFAITYSLGILPASVVGPTDELHSVLAALIAVPVFGEPITMNQAIGMAGIILGIILINASKNEARQSEAKESV